MCPTGFDAVLLVPPVADGDPLVVEDGVEQAADSSTTNADKTNIGRFM
jgi:hypothetical protein